MIIKSVNTVVKQKGRIIIVYYSEKNDIQECKDYIAPIKDKLPCDNVDCWLCEDIVKGRPYNYCRKNDVDCTGRIVNQQSSNTHPAST